MEADTFDGEALTGAEMLHYLTRRNEQQLAEARRKLSEYNELRDVLARLTDRCRVPVMAPVAGGLGYFEATIDYTNNILALLGDGWFAERSAKQAGEIVHRRLEYLRREVSSLLAESASIAARQDLFLKEVPDAERAVAEVAASAASAASAVGPTKGAGAASGAPAVAEEEAAAWGAAVEDIDLTVMDEQDQLTEDELLEIERELGDRIEDDELVERIMTERLIAKKERRVQDELRRRAESAKTAQALPARAASAEPEKPAPVFRTPGDIGAASASISAPASAAHEPTKKHVAFKETVEYIEPPVELPTQTHFSRSSGGALHDVVERTAPTAAAAGAAKAGGKSTKKKSLFLQDLERAGGSAQ